MRTCLLIPAFLLSATPLSLAAQRDGSTVPASRTPRRAVLAVVGALVGGAGSAVLHHDGCGTACRACTIGAGTLIGGIAGLALAARDTLLAAATSTGVTILYLYPPIRGPGVLLREGTIQAATASDDHVFFALGPRSEWAPLDSDSARTWPALALDAPVVDLEWDGRRRTLWALALAGARLYVGAGAEGVLVIDASAAPPRPLGLAFDLGFAATLLSRDGYTYILDRRTSSVRRNYSDDPVRT